MGRAIAYGDTGALPDPFPICQGSARYPLGVIPEEPHHQTWWCGESGDPSRHPIRLGHGSPLAAPDGALAGMTKLGELRNNLPFARLISYAIALHPTRW